VHSNKDLSTTTPLVLHHDRDAAAGSTVDPLDDGGPEHGEGAGMLAAAHADDDLEELEPGPSDVNGG